MNILESSSNELVFTDYSSLLEKILQVLKTPQKHKLFKVSSDGQRLLIDIDSVASQVATLQVDNPLGGAVNNIRTATINLNPGYKECFEKQIREIKNCLQHLLPDEIDKKFISKLITDLQTFKSDKESLSFDYPFTPYPNLEKQRLTVSEKNTKGKQLLRFHKLTISVQRTSEFNQQLLQGLENYIRMQFPDDSQEELGYILEDLSKEKEKSESDFYRLKDIIDSQTLGKLKKQAQINYLEYLHEHSEVNAEGSIYLQDMIRRLKLIEEYINDVNKADGDYLVNYAGVSLNYRDIFSRGEAFDMLPIIPKIEGYLGETKDEQRGEIQFIFGLKLKFDGKVQTNGGRNVFDYYLNLLNPDSKEHQAELIDLSKRETFIKKVLRIAFLYYFLFAGNQNTESIYDPISAFEQKVRGILQSGDDQQKQHLFRKLIEGFNKLDVQSKIKKIKTLLIKVINRQTAFHTREYPLHITLNRGILEQDIHQISNQNTFFKSVIKGNPKEVLKYISIGQANAKSNSVCTFPAKVTISDIHYVASEEKQSFSMEYELTGISVLPVLLLPFQDKKCRDIYEKNFSHRRLILLPYRLESSQLETQQAFIYQFTFSLLIYTCLKMLLHQHKLFIPILRLHLHNKDDDAPIEKFIASFSSILSHLLNEEYRANTQGVDIRDLKYKILNVLSSLYSVLPKKFTFTNSSDCPKLVDKLAIIIVSSRESDGKWNSSQKISNLMGEILGFTCQNSAVRIQLIKTFSANYEHQQMFRQPTVIIDTVAKLYEKGYRHFVYIAKAPYTSTLHMTQSKDDDGLFFLSREVIQALKAQHDDIKIYPMFFDKYYAVNLQKIGTSSLYIQDTAELASLVDDPSQKSVLFFNLFNGIVVGKGEQRNYNGVISYATLLNIYQGILDDEDIRKGLIYKGELKKEILQYLTLFHFSRYEKAKEINLKLDPYESLIGDHSVGANSLLKHPRGRVDFNLLAFLTQVKEVLNVELKN